MKRILFIIPLLLCLFSEAQHLPFRGLRLSGGTTTPPVDPPPTSGVARMVVVFGQSNATEIAPFTEYASPFRPQDIDATKEFIWTGSSFSSLLAPTTPFLGTANNAGDGVDASSNIKLTTVELVLGKLMSTGLNDSVFIPKHSVGGTNLHTQWKGYLSDELINKILSAKAALIAQGYDSILIDYEWNQGEGDSWDGRTQAQYYADLNTLFAKLQNAVGVPHAIAVMQIHYLGGGATTPQKNAIRAAQAQFVADAPTTRKLIDIDAFLLRDDYHFFGDCYTYIAEEAAELFLGTTITNSSPPADFTKATMWKTPYPWYWIGSNNYYGQGGITRDAVIVNGVGGSISCILPGGSLSLFSGAGGSHYFSINESGGATITVKYLNTTVHSEAFEPGKYYRLQVSSGGVVTAAKSTNGTTWTTIHTFSQSGSGNWYVSTSMPFNTTWQNVIIQ